MRLPDRIRRRRRVEEKEQRAKASTEWQLAALTQRVRRIERRIEGELGIRLDEKGRPA